MCANNDHIYHLYHAYYSDTHTSPIIYPTVPQNLLIDKDGYAKLADFGMADKLVDGISHSHGGTIVYMSPESRDADSDRTQKKTHDFFAVGVMLFRMLTNKFPFQVATHDYNTVVSMHLTSQLMNDAADDKVKKNLQIEQQDELLGKGDLEKTYKLTDFMKTHIKDPEAVDLISKLLVYDESKRIGAQDGAGECPSFFVPSSTYSNF